MSTEDASSASNPLSYYVSIFSGVCLAISELLPYISKVKGNGIVQVLIQSFGKFEETKRKEEEQQQQVIQSILDRLDHLTALVQEKSQS
jgi:hypothetical protein